MADLQRAAEEICAGLDWLADVAPGAERSFRALLASSMADASTAELAKAQALLALAMAAAGRCEDCIARQARAAATTGASRDEVVTTLQRAVLMSDGPAAVYAADALARFDTVMETAGFAEPVAQHSQPGQRATLPQVHGAPLRPRRGNGECRAQTDVAKSAVGRSYGRLSEAVATAHP